MDDVRLKQMYLPDTNVLLTRFLTQDGVGEITDFMPVGEMRHTHVLVRRVKAVRGPFNFHLECRPRFDYARADHRVEERDGEVWFISKGDDSTTLRLHIDVPFTIERRRHRRLHPGVERECRLHPGDDLLRYAESCRGGGLRRPRARQDHEVLA